MIQEIYCKAVLKFTDMPVIGEVGKSIRKIFPISKVETHTPDSVIVELVTEYNAAYARTKVKKWVYGDLVRLDIPDLETVTVLELMEEAEIYGNV